VKVFGFWIGGKSLNVAANRAAAVLRDAELVEEVEHLADVGAPATCHERAGLLR